MKLKQGQEEGAVPPVVSEGSSELGRDELNLAEFPLSGIGDRFLDARKTAVLTDQVWDRDQRQFVARELALSGSDRYGLPTAKDDDVLLACIQLSGQQGFRSREVHFSRYALLALLHWAQDGRSYARLATSLRRWKGLTIYSTRAFYDHARRSWVNRDFGVFDSLYLYERERQVGDLVEAKSRLVWNEVLFDNFRAGYLKRLDWDLYCRLTSPIAKRLYRLLDKRFFHGDEVRFDLADLAFRKLRMSENYNTAQIKRALRSGIEELETLWQLRPAKPEQRFLPRESGTWEVVFERRRPPRLKLGQVPPQVEQATDLEVELARREVGPATAAELVQQQPAETVRTMVRLFDWYAAKGQTKGPGFLVDSIRNPAKYRLPREFKVSLEQGRRQQPPNSRKQAGTESSRAAEAKRLRREKSRQDRFLAFWRDLPETDRQAFEAAALATANPTKLNGYRRNQPSGGPALEHYRQVILLDHFERLHVSQRKSSGST